MIEKAKESDLSEILFIQKKAFLEVARQFSIEETTLPPLRQTYEEINSEFSESLFLKAVDNGKIVGSVRATGKDDTCHIKRLVVLPEYQNRGIGTKLMREIEGSFQDQVQRYELFTGSRDERNRHLYKKLGYRIFKEEKLNNAITFIFMEKVI